MLLLGIQVLLAVIATYRGWGFKPWAILLGVFAIAIIVGSLAPVYASQSGMLQYGMDVIAIILVGRMAILNKA